MYRLEIELSPDNMFYDDTPPSQQNKKKNKLL